MPTDSNPKPPADRLPGLPLIDERIKWFSFTRFKAKLRNMKKSEIESFKHFEEVWQIEEEAILVPYEMWLRIQQILSAQEKMQ